VQDKSLLQPFQLKAADASIRSMAVSVTAHHIPRSSIPSN
jgi:hypothetical protein